MIRIACAALWMAFAAATPSLAFDVSAMTDAERDAFRNEIRDYLIENPEVLVEAFNALEARQAAEEEMADLELVSTYSEDIFEDSHSWVGGNPDGDVVVVEFLDYRCHFCQKAHAEVAELLNSDGNIRYIIKEFPILGEQSMIASRFALSTKLNIGDDAYAQVHDALMTMRGNMTPASLTAVAERFDLDADVILGGMEDEAITEIIQKNHALAQTLRINGTPTFVMGDQMVRGFLPLAGMQDMVTTIRAN